MVAALAVTLPAFCAAGADIRYSTPAPVRVEHGDASCTAQAAMGMAMVVFIAKAAFAVRS